MYTVDGIHVFDYLSDVQIIKVVSLIALNEIVKDRMKQYYMTHNYVRYQNRR